MKKPKITAIGLSGMSVFLSADHFHAPGETLRADTLYTEPGGKAFNQAVAAARLGGEVSFIGAVGNDDSGLLCRRFLEAEHIRSELEVIPDIPTAYACILTDRLGENRVTVFRGAAERLSAGFIRSRESVLAESDVLLLGLECPIDATLAALETAQQHGVFTLLNPAPALPLPLETLRAFDLITPNRQEASVLFGISEAADDRELAERILSCGIRRAAVTLGSRGSLLVEGGHACLIPALPVEAVDTTGAGDTFSAALAVNFRNGENLREAAVYASAAAALSVSRPHVMTALPREKELRGVPLPFAPQELF